MATTDLTNKTIIVTGAGSGIGRATCFALARAHATVILCDINGPSTQAVLESLEADPTTASSAQQQQSHPRAPHSAHTLDVTSPQACNDFITQLTRTHSPITGLFNCAGINPTEMPLTSTTDEYFHQLIATNLAGPYHLTRALIPHLQPHTGCAIVNVSSTAGLRASAGFAIYNMTKFGIIGFTKSMALELGPKGIRVNAVAPGPVDTPTNASVLMGEEEVRKMAGRVAMGRLGLPEEVADVVVFLFGEGARWCNGSVVEVTGGM